MVIGEFASTLQCIDKCHGKSVCMHMCIRDNGYKIGECIEDMGECSVKKCAKLCIIDKEKCGKCIKKHCYKEFVGCLKK